MKKCELCNSVARMYCESDQATLCWGCDARVHTANFLVAKHPRILLCHSCHSQTPWTASGPKLGPIVSLCEACANRNPNAVNGDRTHGDNTEDENGNGDGDPDDDEDDGDNQVVPLSTTPQPPPVASSSSSSEDTSGRYLGGKDRPSSSIIGFFSSRTSAKSRFPSNSNGRNQENGGRKSSSWT